MSKDAFTAQQDSAVNGRLIVLEGVDGVGKSSLAVALLKRYRANNRAGVVCSFPGSEPGTVGNLVYKLHHDPISLGILQITPSALQAMHIAAHIDSIERAIEPALKGGTDVILDRYWWSTIAYGKALGASPALLQQLAEVERRIWSDIVPFVVFYITSNRAETEEKEDASLCRLLDIEYRKLMAEASGMHPIIEISNDCDLCVTLAEIEQYLPLISKRTV